MLYSHVYEAVCSPLREASIFDHHENAGAKYIQAKGSTEHQS